MKSLRTLLLALLLCVCLSGAALAADGVTTGTASIGGSTAQVVYVTMTSGRALVPGIANNSIHTDAAASSVISSVKSGTVVAAINGGFFDSYYNSGATVSMATGNYPRVYSTVISEGYLVCAGGSGSVAAIGMDYSGNIYIDSVELIPTVTIQGSTVVNAWGANVQYSDASATYVLTDILDYAINIPSTSKVVTIRNNQVVSIANGTNGYTVPTGATVLVYNQTAWNNAVQWDKQPLLNDSAVYSYTATPSTKANSSAWSDMRTVLAGGGVLVLNGKNATAQNANVAADQQPNVSGQRAFVAQMADGRIMMGTVNSSFNAIADSLVAMGVKNAIYVDGGASSMLYANGSYLTTAGRKLTTIIAFADETKTATRPNKTTTISGSTPSSWASDAVSRAKELNMLPDDLDGNYNHNITRSEFCKLVAKFIRVKTGCSIEYYCTKNEVTVNQKQFTDLTGSEYYVPYVAALGIVNGTSATTFSPKAEIKRQDAAAMLMRLAKVLGNETSGTPRTFTDSAQISSYAVDAVNFVTGLGIMNGNASGTFSPKNSITREQAILTIMNAYDNLTYSES
jgi:hypothetical protein